MWTALKLLLSGSLRGIVAALKSWLAGEAAKFAVDYLADAKRIIREVEQTELRGLDKFAEASYRLSQQLKDSCIEHKDRWVNTAVQIAFDEIYDELHPEQEKK